MAFSKIADFRLAQDRSGGFVYFRILQEDGSIGDPLKGQWKTVPFSAFSSLVGILFSGEAVYDPSKDMFGVTLRGNRQLDLTETKEVEFTLPVRKRKKPTAKKTKKPSNKKGKK